MTQLFLWHCGTYSPLLCGKMLFPHRCQRHWRGRRQLKIKQYGCDCSLQIQHPERHLPTHPGRGVEVLLHSWGSQELAPFDGRVTTSCPQELSLKGLCHPNWWEVCWHTDDRMTAMQKGSTTVMIGISMGLAEVVMEKYIWVNRSLFPALTQKRKTETLCFYWGTGGGWGCQVGLKSTFVTEGGSPWLYVLTNFLPKVVDEDESQAWLINVASWSAEALRVFTNSCHWHCHVQLTGVSKARTGWLNPNSTGGGVSPTSSQILTTAYCIFVPAWWLSPKNKWCWDFSPSLLSCPFARQTRLMETGWGFERSQSVSQLIISKRLIISTRSVVSQWELRLTTTTA